MSQIFLIHNRTHPSLKQLNCECVIEPNLCSQELIIVDELLAAMMGIDGNYVHVRKGRENDLSFVFSVDPRLNSSLHVRQPGFLHLAILVASFGLMPSLIRMMIETTL